MLRRAAALSTALVAASVLVGPAVSPASADDEPDQTVWVSRDKIGDVKILRGTRLTKTEKRSVDIRKVRFELADNGVRITVGLKRIISTSRFDQMVFVSWAETSPSSDYAGDVGMTTAGESYASYYDAAFEDVENCDVPVRNHPRRREISGVVPWACMPEGPLKISVQALTGDFRTDNPPYSRDRHAFPGRPAIVAGT